VYASQGLLKGIFTLPVRGAVSDRVGDPAKDKTERGLQKEFGHFGTSIFDCHAAAQ
jgi:hypothetical protein